MTQLDFAEPPPAFGHAMLKYFAFDKDYVNLNHGSYGSLPLPVLAACDKLTLRVESNPDLFVRVEQTPLITKCRAQIAKFVGAKTDEIVLVRNTSHGINTIMRSFEWNTGDVIVTCSTTYDAMAGLARFLHDGPGHPNVATFVLQWPTSHAAIIAAYRAHLQSLPRHPGQKVVAIIDSVVSVPGALMPWVELVQICKELNVYSVIDGAHSIGQEPHINLGWANPDFWVSNCHKWLFAKRGCAVMFVAERNQGIVKSSFPTSKLYLSPADRAFPGESFIEQYNWNGTIDFVPPLSITAALEFREYLGGEYAINGYCHDMAVRGGARLATLFGTRVMDESGEFTLNMVNVQIPVPSHVPGPSEAVTTVFYQKLLAPTNRTKVVSASVFWHNGAWWVRCSAQIWTQMEDFEVLGEVLEEVCREVGEEVRARPELFVD
ncbi:pyridoxal phosphate-dependent transferase [Mycena filopes]|nr:pyridoxal phosphate-dependent transferase [Mycena filopes]